MMDADDDVEITGNKGDDTMRAAPHAVRRTSHLAPATCAPLTRTLLLAALRLCGAQDGQGLHRCERLREGLRVLLLLGAPGPDLQPPHAVLALTQGVRQARGESVRGAHPPRWWLPGL